MDPVVDSVAKMPTKIAIVYYSMCALSEPPTSRLRPYH